MKQGFPEIKVETRPNGYSLTYEGMKQKNGFLYYSPEKLVAGINMHIGLEYDSELSMDGISEFIKTANRWNDNAKCVAEITRLGHVVKRLENSIEICKKECFRHRDRMVRVLEMLRDAQNASDMDSHRAHIQNAIRSLSTVKSLTKKEVELMNTPDENEENDDDE